MGLKKIFTLSLFLAVILLAIPSGNVSATPPVEATVLDLSISYPPKLGETSELTFTTLISAVTQDLTNARAWVEFSYANTQGSYSEAKYAVPISLDEVLVNGELYWEGNAEDNRLVELTGTIQLPREGVWIITGYFFAEGWESPFDTERKIAVTKDAAAIMGTEDFKSGPLSYLANFNYGGVSDRRVPDESDPVILELDISKAPSVGEEVLLTCRISSIIDWTGYSAEFRFAKRSDDNSAILMTADNLLIGGELSWHGDLKKDEPIEFSATIKFPEAGDWEIEVLGDHPKYLGNFLSVTMKMNIADDRGSFGWGEWQGSGNLIWVIVGGAALLAAVFVVWRRKIRK